MEPTVEFDDELQIQFDLLNESEEQLSSYFQILNNERTDENALRLKEVSIYRFEDLIRLIEFNSAFFNLIPKARTAKIIRNLITTISTAPNSLEFQINFCINVVNWCKSEKRTFLRQRIEAKLAHLLLLKKDPIKALTLVDDLLKELRKLDDKQMLTEVHLTEARIYHALRNIPKSKASLTASRTAANSIYVVPVLQAEIDEMSGILHCEEGDYTTAHSYFLEAFDAYDQASNKDKAISCLQYMILCKVLNNLSHEVANLLSSKNGLKYNGKQVEAMATIAKASRLHSLEDFKVAVDENLQYLQSDDLISHHLDLLYDKMLETNLLKLIHPFSCVELTHVANLIQLPEETVIRKLSQMILDHKFHGILDQGKGYLIVYESTHEDMSFSKGSEIIGNLGSVVDALFYRTKGLVKPIN
eukprot:gene6493-6993_t